MRPHHRGQQLPRPAPAVHPDHPEDLQEAEEPHAGGDEHVVGRPQPDHDQRRPDHYYVCERGRKNVIMESINLYKIKHTNCFFIGKNMVKIEGGGKEKLVNRKLQGPV